MKSNHTVGSRGADSLFDNGSMLMPAQEDNDPGQVRMADLEKELHNHRPVTSFLRTDLVTDATDPNLINPWGMSDSGGGSPIWISQNGAGVTSLYGVAHDPATGVDKVTPNTGRPAVNVGPPSDPLSPTGQVFNPFNGTSPFTKAFEVGTDALGNGIAASFIFATKEGTIEGWSGSLVPNTQTVTVVPSADGAMYTGLGIDHNPGDTPMLYAANFSAGTIDVFDGEFHQVTNLAPDAFTNSHMDEDFAPFNVQVLSVGSDERVFVTYARQDALTPGPMSDDGHGGGFVDEFDLQGKLIQRFESHGSLDTPWGLAIAPSTFGSFAGDLLVGNHGDGTITAFDLNGHDDKPLGHLLDGTGHEITIDDLWGLIPGGTNAGTSTGNSGGFGTLYFTAGTDNGTHGLFGSLTANATPLQIGMMGPGGH